MLPAALQLELKKVCVKSGILHYFSSFLLIRAETDHQNLFGPLPPRQNVKRKQQRLQLSEIKIMVCLPSYTFVQYMGISLGYSRIYIIFLINRITSNALIMFSFKNVSDYYKPKRYKFYPHHLNDWDSNTALFKILSASHNQSVGQIIASGIPEPNTTSKKKPHSFLKHRSTMSL